MKTSKLSSVEVSESLKEDKIFQNVPKSVKKRLLKQIAKGELTERELRRIIAKTKAVQGMLEREEEEVQMKAEKVFKDLYYTGKLNAKEAIWELEEIAGDAHKLVEREFPLEQFASEEEAQAWAVERGGVCLGKTAKWKIKYDPIRDKRLKEAKKKA